MGLLTGSAFHSHSKSRTWSRDGESLPVRQVQRFPPERVLYVRRHPDISRGRAVDANPRSSTGRPPRLPAYGTAPSPKGKRASLVRSFTTADTVRLKPAGHQALGGFRRFGHLSPILTIAVCPLHHRNRGKQGNDMKKTWILVVLAAASPAFGQNVDGGPMTYAKLMAQAVPVTSADITDHPYKVIGQIKTNVRKATMFSHASSDDKMDRELWERGKKMGADAVILAQHGDEHISALSWGASTARGEAVKFVN